MKKLIFGISLFSFLSILILREIEDTSLARAKRAKKVATEPEYAPEKSD